MSYFTARAIVAFAGVLNKAMTTDAKADLLNFLVGIDAEPKFSDSEDGVGEKLFDELSARCPEAVDLATSR